MVAFCPPVTDQETLMTPTYNVFAVFSGEQRLVRLKDRCRGNVQYITKEEARLCSPEKKKKREIQDNTILQEMSVCTMK